MVESSDQNLSSNKGDSIGASFRELPSLPASAPIGRKIERKRLQESWANVCAGSKAAIVLVGEAGYGKTLLTNDLCATISTDKGKIIRFNCVFEHEGSSYHPIINYLKSISNILPDDPLALKLTKLNGVLPRQMLSSPIIDRLFGIDIGSTMDIGASPDQIRTRIFYELMTYFFAMAVDAPLLIVIEDAQWMDPTTEAFVDKLLSAMDNPNAVGIFVLITARPKSPICRNRRLRQINLSVLSRKHSEALARRTAGKGIQASALKLIVDRGHGIPLHIERLTTRWVKTGRVPMDHNQSIQLFVRPDDAAPYRSVKSELVNLLACISTKISREFIMNLPIESDPDSKSSAIDDLVRTGILCREFGPGEELYEFSEHAREFFIDAIDAVQNSSRQKIVAEALTSFYPQLGDATPEIFAMHYSKAHMSDKAVEWWLKACTRALNNSSYKEALAHVARAFDDLKRVEVNLGIAKYEIRFRLASVKCRACMALYGYGAIETLAATEYANELAQQIDDESVYPILYISWLCEATRARHKEATKLAVSILDRVRRSKFASVAQFVGSKTLGVSMFFQGRFSEARAHLSTAVELYENVRPPLGPAADYGYDLGAGVYAYISWCLVILGEPEAAAVEAAKLEKIISQTPHRYTAAVGLVWMSVLNGLRENWSVAARQSALALQLASANDFVMLTPIATLIGTAAQSLREKVELRFIEKMQICLDEYQNTGAIFRSSIFLYFIAKALYANGMFDEALLRLSDLEIFASTTGETCLQAEVYRLRGKIVGTREKSDATTFLIKAAELGRAQSAFLFERLAQADLAATASGQTV